MRLVVIRTVVQVVAAVLLVEATPEEGVPPCRIVVVNIL
jgi:hypothetical protein